MNRLLYVLVVLMALLPIRALNMQTQSFKRFKRQAISIVVSCGFLGAGCPSAFAAADMKTFTDSVHKVSVNYPSSWTENKAELSGDRTVDAFVNPADASASISYVWTPIPADFAKLTSFGDLDGYLIPKGEGVKTEVIKKETKGDKMTLEYVTSAPNNPTRHVITVFALRSAEGVAGLTAQSDESSFKSNEPLFKEAVQSLKM